MKAIDSGCRFSLNFGCDGSFFIASEGNRGEFSGNFAFSRLRESAGFFFPIVQYYTELMPRERMINTAENCRASSALLSVVEHCTDEKGGS
jgi:hypothetical protein